MNYWVAIDGETSGPYPAEQVVGMLQKGQITPDTQVMAEGGQEWMPLSAVPNLQGAASTPPAPAPPAKPIPTLRGSTTMQVGGTRPATQQGGVGQPTAYVAPPTSTTPVVVIIAVILVVGGLAAFFVYQRNSKVRAEVAAAKAIQEAEIAKAEAVKAAEEAKAPVEGVDFLATAEVKQDLTIVDGQQTRFHKLVVQLTAQGGAASKAYAVGPVVTEPMTMGAETYQAVEPADNGGYRLIDGASQGAVVVEMDFGKVPESITKTGPVKGQLSVLVGGSEKTVEIQDLVTRETGAIDDPTLSAAGMTAMFRRNEVEGELEVSVELGRESARSVSGFELLDSKGNPINSGSKANRSANGETFSRRADEGDLEGAILRLRFREGAEEVTLPFDLPSVEVTKP